MPYDLAIRWTDDPDALGQIRKHRGVTVHAVPRQFRCPGGRVVVVQSGGQVPLTYVAERIDGPLLVRLADGAIKHNGYICFSSVGSGIVSRFDGTYLDNFDTWMRRRQRRCSSANRLGQATKST